MGINTGKIDENGNYVKYVSFAKAVLWKNRELSLRPSIIMQLKMRGCQLVRFVDEKKKEEWQFIFSDIVENGSKKSVGQEEQIYFPIALAKIIKI